ncbi:N(6)-adenine-specific methyltransferase METTL4 [Scyliorhinus torazame]|uniref:N(6)-adenine-specific methyltransferase METTL4 n=1 Tax=Scyliorhinus torazame TaxID=75743 RepID=UPI003B599553
MSVVKSDIVGWLLDHLAYINQSYRCCHHIPLDTQCHRYVFKAEYFDIGKPHIADSDIAGGQEPGSGDSRLRGRKCKRKSREPNQGELEAQEYHEKVSQAIRDGTRKLIEQSIEVGEQGTDTRVPAGEDCSKKQITPVIANSMLIELCSMAKQMVQEQHQPVQVISDEAESVEDLNLLAHLTENSSDCARIVMLMGHRYLLPPRSSFLLSDISCMEPLLGYKKYDLITLDPPWENKSVKRSRGYSYLFPWQIQQIPVPALSAPGCLVVSWVTNRQRHLRFVKEELYPSWSIEVVAEWHWVKVTRHGEFVVPLDSTHKKPYEILVLGRYKGSSERQNGEPITKTVAVPDCKLLVSVPCVLHSHKPPLGEVLKGLTRPHPKCLELFARNLQPGWTSWGNEVLRFQHLDYFQELDTMEGGSSCCYSQTSTIEPIVPSSC